MSGTARAALIALGVIVAIAAFVVLRPSEEDDQQAQTTSSQSASPAGSSGAGQQAPSKPPAPKPTKITVADGEPVGGVEKVKVDSGERVQMMVESDTTDQVHVHGYNRSAKVSPGSPARISFPAKLEGVYEIELEGAGVQIAQLQVSP